MEDLQDEFNLRKEALEFVENYQIKPTKSPKKKKLNRS
jgi:hypothetical protein